MTVDEPRPLTSRAAGEELRVSYKKKYRNPKELLIIRSMGGDVGVYRLAGLPIRSIVPTSAEPWLSALRRAPAATNHGKLLAQASLTVLS